jgi:hypothetical protein
LQFCGPGDERGYSLAASVASAIIPPKIVGLAIPAAKFRLANQALRTSVAGVAPGRRLIFFSDESSRTNPKPRGCRFEVMSDNYR